MWSSRTSAYHLTKGPHNSCSLSGFRTTGKVNRVHSFSEKYFKKLIIFVIGFNIIGVLSTLILTEHSSICQVVWNLKIPLPGCKLLILVYCGTNNLVISNSGAPRNFVGGGLNKFNRGQREQGSRGGSLLVRGSAQFVNEWTPYSY
jgi:hypothetical protein